MATSKLIKTTLKSYDSKKTQFRKIFTSHTNAKQHVNSVRAKEIKRYKLEINSILFFNFYIFVICWPQYGPRATFGKTLGLPIP